MNSQPPSLPPPQERCGLALASLILGIAGLVLCVIGPLLGIPAVICGHMAQSRISKSGGRLSGSGQALAGLITGYIAIVMVVFIGLLATIAMPNFMKARQTSRQTIQKIQCVMNLRTIENAKQSWALDNKKRNSDTPTDADLFGNDKFIREKPDCPAGGVYSLNPMSTKPSCSIPEHTY